MNELLPCPFCGGKAKLYDNQEHPYIYRVACTDCKTAYGYSYSHSEKQTAIKTWNKRIPLISIPGVKEMVKEAWQDGYQAHADYPDMPSLVADYMKSLEAGNE